MDDNMKTLSSSMQETIEFGNFEFLGDIGELVIDSTLNDGLLKDIPVLGTLVGVGKCIRNAYDYLFAKKLIAFLLPIKSVPPEVRSDAIKRWENDDHFRGNVGDTLIGMIERCDNTVKAAWLSELFYELVLKRNCSRLFMRAEKTLSSLSVMDLQAFLCLPKDKYNRIKEGECEPFIGSGLYKSPSIDSISMETMDFSNQYCESTEIGYLVYNILNGNPNI